MDNHHSNNRPGNHVESGMPTGRVQAIPGQKEFLQELREQLLHSFHEHMLDVGYDEDDAAAVKQFPVSYDRSAGIYRMGVPIYASGGVLRRLGDAEDILKDAAMKAGIGKYYVNGRTWYEIQSPNLRQLVDVYNEGLLRRMNPERCIDMDALAEKHGFDLDAGRSVA